MLPIRDRLPRRHAPVVNWLLILLNVAAFVWERYMLALGYPSQRFEMEWALVPRLLVQHPLEMLPNVFTSMFLHDPTSLAHIAGNMLFLWIFGDNVEDALGKGRYLLFYLLSGMAAAAAQVLIDPTSMVPMVGASGAIAGVLAAYVTLYPRAPITVLNPIPILWLFWGLFIELPAWIVILEFFLFNLWHGFTSLGHMAGGGIAFFAHIGGFVAGLFLVRLFLPERGPRDHDRWEGLRPSRTLPPRYYPQQPHRRWD
jgi:membrane associated rhomboid family serine protease